MTRMEINFATRLLHNDLSLRLVQRRGEEVDWTSDRTRESFTFTDAEMAAMIARGEASFLAVEDRRRQPPRISPDDVTPQQRSDAEHRLEYVLDLHKADLAHRAHRDDFSRQVLATADRLADRSPPSNRTVKRWLVRCGDKPHWLILVERTRCKGNRTPRLTPEQIAIVDQVIDEFYMRREGCSVDALVPYVANAIRIANLDRPSAERLPAIRRKAIVGVLAMREQRAIDLARHGPAYAAHKHNRVTFQADPKAPLDKIEIDHTVADLFVVSDKDRLPIGRPTIGFAIDRCTRMPFGLYAGFEPPSMLTVMQILKNGIFPKDYVRAKMALKDPEDRWDFKHDWPVWGMPRMLMFDLAMENRTHDLKQAAMELGIREIQFAARRSGNQKGAVERWFRTQNETLLWEQRGTTFANVIARGDYDSKKNAVISMSGFIRMLHRFMIDIYPHTPHAGLDGDTPARRWNELIDRYPSDPVLPMEEMLHLFTRSFKAKLRVGGVRFKWMYYDSDELDAHRNSAGFKEASPKGMVSVRYDPADLSRVWVSLPHQGGAFLSVPVQPRWSEYATGLSLWEHDQIRRYRRAKFADGYTPETLGEAKAGLSADMAAEAGLSRNRKRKARLDGTARTSMAGRSTATTPQGSAQDRADRKGAGRPANDRTGPNETRPDQGSEDDTLLSFDDTGA